VFLLVGCPVAGGCGCCGAAAVWGVCCVGGEGTRLAAVLFALLFASRGPFPSPLSHKQRTTTPTHTHPRPGGVVVVVCCCPRATHARTAQAHGAHSTPTKHSHDEPSTTDKPGGVGSCPLLSIQQQHGRPTQAERRFCPPERCGMLSRPGPGFRLRCVQSVSVTW